MKLVIKKTFLKVFSWVASLALFEKWISGFRVVTMVASNLISFKKKTHNVLIFAKTRLDDSLVALQQQINL